MTGRETRIERSRGKEGQKRKTTSHEKRRKNEEGRRGNGERDWMDV